jgi:hypothetical protein
MFRTRSLSQDYNEGFADIPGVFTYVDDILISGATKEEHDERLERVLERCRRLNLKLNLSKCHFSQAELQYLGHVLSSDGIKPDPAKVEAVMTFPTPKSRSEVAKLLGLVTYLAKFCPDLAEIAQPIRQLTKKEVEWAWDAIQDDTLTKLKKLVSSAPVLALFNPSLPIKLTVDASQCGLGAALIQNGRPVEYASRTMSQTQRQYAQIEKEMLAVQFGLEKFHQYVYGQEVIVETDHKPLLGIAKKPLTEVSPRLQRMRLRCLRYHYQLEYHPGKDMVVADSLSRFPSETVYRDHDALTEEQFAAVVEQTIPTPLGRERCKEMTAKDPTMQALITYLQTGWPDSKKHAPGPVKPFWTVRYDLTMKDGIVFKGQQAVVPVALRKTVLRGIHDGHCGIVKCIERAKQAVYWPGYVNDIQDMVESCSICQESRRANSQPEMHPREVPLYPFQEIGTDLYELQGTHYLLTVDYYSKWVNITPLRTTTSADVITALDSQFADYGIPEVVCSDNGPQYASSEFSQFAQRLGFRHSTSSPTYPASNGQAERSVQTAKHTMEKMFKEGRTVPDVLRVLRNTPIGGGLPTPATLLQGRRLRTQLSVNTDTLLPQQVNAEEIRKLLQQKQAQQAFYSRARRAMPPTLLPGENVRAQKGKKWIPARVLTHHTQSQSYLVETQGGRVWRRNRSQLNRTQEIWEEGQFTPHRAAPPPLQQLLDADQRSRAEPWTTNPETSAADTAATRSAGKEAGIPPTSQVTRQDGRSTYLATYRTTFYRLARLDSVVFFVYPRDR